MPTENDLSRAAEAYLRIVYRCADPAALGIAERREVALAALAGRPPFVELARALPPDPELTTVATPVARRRGAHPGAFALARLAAWGALAWGLIELAPPALTPAAVLVAAVAVLDAALSARKVLALLASRRDTSLCAGALGVLAGAALVAVGAWLVTQLANLDAGRRAPSVAIGAYLAAGGVLLVASVRWLRAEARRA